MLLNQTIRAIFTLLAAGALSSCAINHTLTPPQSSLDKRWVVVSAMGDEAHFQHIGTTVFNNVYKNIDVASWRLDQANETSVRNLWPQLHWQTLKFSPEERKAFAHIVPDGQLIMFQSRAPREAAIRLLGSICGCDYAIVISPANVGDYISNTNQQLLGYGVHQRGMLGLSNKAYSYVTYSVVLLNMRKDKEIGSVGEDRYEELPFTLHKTADLVPTPVHLAQIHRSIEDLFTNSLPEALPQLKK